MGAFKERVYGRIQKEVVQFETEPGGREPFLYGYLRQKKEEVPRLVLLKAYQSYLQGDCKSPQRLADTAAALVPESACEAGDFLSPDQCRALVEEALRAIPCNEKRKDRYVQLRERELLFQCAIQPDRWQYFMYLLEVACAHGVSVSQEVFALFSSVWEGLRRAVPALRLAEIPPAGETRKRFRQRLEILQNSAGRAAPGAIPWEAIPLQTLERLTEGLLQLVIKADATAWLYDAGYPLREQPGNGRARKADHTMELLDAFYRERSDAFGGGASFDLDAAWEDVTGLFALLDQEKDEKKRKKRRGVVVPIVIDAATGAGLYIMGTDCVRASLPLKQHWDAYCKRHNCCYYVTYPGKFLSSGGKGIFYATDDDEQIYESGKLKDAYDYYTDIIDLAGQLDGYAFYFYQNANAEPPEGCPEAYLKYFECDRDEPELMLEELDRPSATRPGHQSATRFSKI